MSVFSSLVVCLLCLVSLSTSSSARPMGVINKLPHNSTLQNPSKSSNKLNEVETTTKTSKENIATLWDHRHKKKPQEATTTSSKSQVHHQQHDEQKVADLNHKGRQVHHHHHHEAKVSKNSTSSKFNKTTVSWRVPGKKKRMPQPGFNLDYAPPKVHPPVHN